VLAYLQREAGYEAVQRALTEGACISAVNLAEVLSKVVSKGIDAELVRVRLDALGLRTVSFGDVDALLSAQLYPTTKAAGLSLGDRACLALASRLGVTALTSDTAWKGVAAAISVELIR
jgi:ribonuclease VapC